MEDANMMNSASGLHSIGKRVIFDPLDGTQKQLKCFHLEAFNFNYTF